VPEAVGSPLSGCVFRFLSAEKIGLLELALELDGAKDPTVCKLLAQISTMTKILVTKRKNHLLLLARLRTVRSKGLSDVEKKLFASSETSQQTQNLLLRRTHFPRLLLPSPCQVLSY
jgi:transcriptional accessory protein Tex/SPT6